MRLRFMHASSLAVLVLVECLSPTLQVRVHAQTPVPDSKGVYHFSWVDADGRSRQYVFEPPGRIEPTLTLERLDPVGTGRWFSYRLSNEKRAVQKVFACFMDVGLPTRVERLPSDWDAFMPSAVAKRAGWYRRGTVDGSFGGVEPGALVDGVVLWSEALPGVTTFTCESDVQPNGAPEDLPAWIGKALESLPSTPEVHGTTIGPVIEAAGLPPARLAEALVRNYRQHVASSRLPRRREIVAVLDTVRDAARQEDTERLGTELQRLLRELSADGVDQWSGELLSGLRTSSESIAQRLGSRPR